MNRSEHSGSALSYVTDRSVRELSKVVQGLEIITPVLPVDKGKGREVEAEASAGMPIPAPVPSSEEEEEDEIPEVVRSGTLLPGLGPSPQVRGQVSSQVGPMRSTSNTPWFVGPYSVDGRRRVRDQDDRDSSVYTCCIVGSTISNGGQNLYLMDYGRCRTVVRSDGTTATCYCGDCDC